VLWRVHCNFRPVCALAYHVPFRVSSASRALQGLPSGCQVHCKAPATAVMPCNVAWSDFVGKFSGPGSPGVTFPNKSGKYFDEKF